MRKEEAPTLMILARIPRNGVLADIELDLITRATMDVADSSTLQYKLKADRPIVEYYEPPLSYLQLLIPSFPLLN